MLRKLTNKFIPYFLILIFAAMAYLTFYSVMYLPDVSYLRYINPTSTAFTERENRAIKIKWFGYDQMSLHLKQAVIFAEDEAFFEHPGFNIKEIYHAVKLNWKAKKYLRGASTITQQLAKNLYLSPKKTPWRKIKELLIALKLERELPKQRILEIYLNVIHWGSGNYGIGNAAKYYFNTTPSELTKEQAAFLAAIIPSPDNFKSRPPHIAEKIDLILSKL